MKTLNDGTRVHATGTEHDDCEVLVEFSVPPEFAIGQYRGVVEVRCSKSFGQQAHHVKINWSACGSQDLETAEAFTHAMTQATSIARLLEVDTQEALRAVVKTLLSIYGRAS